MTLARSHSTNTEFTKHHLHLGVTVCHSRPNPQLQGTAGVLANCPSHCCDVVNGALTHCVIAVAS